LKKAKLLVVEIFVECPIKIRQMKDLLTLIFCLFLSFHVFGQNTLRGTITDKDTGEGIIFCDVAVYKNGGLVTGAQSDFDGNYTLNLEMGMYDLVFSYVGYSRLKIKDVLIISDKETIVNAKIESSTDFSDMSCGGYIIPLMGMDIFAKGQTFTAKDISNMPIKN